jgi:hypothetical protein
LRGADREPLARFLRRVPRRRRHDAAEDEEQHEEGEGRFLHAIETAAKTNSSCPEFQLERVVVRDRSTRGPKPGRPPPASSFDSLLGARRRVEFRHRRAPTASASASGRPGTVEPGPAIRTDATFPSKKRARTTACGALLVREASGEVGGAVAQHAFAQRVLRRRGREVAESPFFEQPP